MDIQTLNELSKKYGSWASWAIWDSEKIDNTSIISQHVEKLHTNYIIVGLNMSGSDKAASGKHEWFNFHASQKGCRDSWLREVFNKDGHNVQGAYMTDLLKIRESSSKKVHDFIFDPTNSNIISRYKEDFQNELKEVGVKEISTFILFGKEVQSCFHFFTDNKYKSTIPLRHYSEHGIERKQWVNEVLENLNQI